MVNPDNEVQRYLVYLKYWTLNLRPLVVYSEVLFPPNFIIKVHCAKGQLQCTPPPQTIFHVSSSLSHHAFE